MSSTKKEDPIKPFQLKQFLQDIESLGKSRHDITAADVLTAEKCEIFYGLDKRPYQQKLQYLKRLKSSNYKKLLDYHGVTASVATILDVEKEAKIVNDESSVASKRNLTPPGVSTPQKHQSSYCQTPDQPMSETPSSSFPHGDASAAASTLSGMTLHDTLPGVMGTLQQPHKVRVNVDHPEFNDVAQVFKIDNFVYNKHRWTGWEVRFTISPTDKDEWSLTWKSPTELLLCGPSQDAFLASKYYHGENATVSKPPPDLCDEETKTAHFTNDAAMHRNSARKNKYWLYTFPEGTKLDASILLNGDTEKTLKKHFNVVTIDKESCGARSDVKGMVVYWQIVESNGKPTAIEEQTTKDLAAYDF